MYMLFCPTSNGLDILLCRSYKLQNGGEGKNKVCQECASPSKLAKDLRPFLKSVMCLLGVFFGRAGIMKRFLF